MFDLSFLCCKWLVLKQISVVFSLFYNTFYCVTITCFCVLSLGSDRHLALLLILVQEVENVRNIIVGHMFWKTDFHVQF